MRRRGSSRATTSGTRCSGWSRTRGSSGAGQDYLIEHSAGSGKSNTIAWLAHRLSTLFSDANEPVFHKVIVITDRTVLDKQLQQTIYQFDHTPGVVMRIDEDSAQLADGARGLHVEDRHLARCRSSRTSWARSPAPNSAASGTR